MYSIIATYSDGSSIDLELHNAKSIEDAEKLITGNTATVAEYVVQNCLGGEHADIVICDMANKKSLFLKLDYGFRKVG